MRIFCVLVLLNWANALISQVNLSSSLTACYALNGNANDPISSLNGTLSSVTATVDRFNNPNSAFAFSGNAASRIELPNSPLLKANQVSFSAWINMNSLNSYYIVFAHNGCVSYHEGYSFGCANLGGGNYRLQIAKSFSGCNSIGQIILNGATPLTAQTWYHVGFYAGPDSMKLYLNGQLETFIANNNPLVYSPSAKVYLGGSNLGVNLPLSGSLDNVRFYNRKLNGSEFLQLYQQDPACLATPSGTIPSVAFSVSSVSLCAGNSISLTDLSANNPTAWNWQMPGANPPSSNQQNPSITFQNPGTYTVSLVASNNVGASNTGTQSIVVLPNPSLSITGPSVSCSGQTVNLVAGGANSYTWNTTQTGAILNVNPGMTTLYSVSGTDLNGCSNSSSFNLIVMPSPFVTISSSPSVICQGQSVSLTASGAQNYSWSNFQTGSSILVNPNSNSIYQVTGTDANNCSGTASITVNVLSLPQVLATANKTLVCRGNPVILSASGAQSFVWNSALNGSTIQVQPNFSTAYTVVGTASTGCSQQAIIYIQVSECVGLDESAGAGNIRIYPNPVFDVLTIDVPSFRFDELKLTDGLGRELMREFLNGRSELRVDMSHETAGLYFLQLSGGGGSTIIKITKLP